jgi:O-antigen/teichoic acid export membrane protein
MPALRTNIFANYAGQIWMALMGVAFVPVYIRMLGIESFGLVGLMLSIQSISNLLDLGMGGTVNRELARRAHDGSDADRIADLVRTFEWLVWPISFGIFLSIYAGSGLLASRWLHPHHLSQTELANAIRIMGLAVALYWPSGFYSNGLNGLERQSLSNMISAGFATLRSAGVLPVLYFVGPTIDVFMWWHAAVGVAQSLTNAIVLRRLLPPTDRPPMFSRSELARTGRFAAGLVAITALSVALTQLDRVVLSAMRPLADLGYFSLAVSVAAGFARMMQPMFNALYPRYSRLVAENDAQGLSDLYHLSSQCLTVVIAAVATTLFLFARPVLLLWTGDASLSSTVALPLQILVVGTALNGLMYLPYALQLAHGWTRLTIIANTIMLLLGLPYCIWAVSRYGILGASSLWLVVNLGMVAFALPAMHQRLLRGELRRWYAHDVLPPLLAAAGTAAICAWLFRPMIDRSATGLALLSAAGFMTLASATLASAGARRLVFEHLPPSMRRRQ